MDISEVGFQYEVPREYLAVIIFVGLRHPVEDKLLVKFLIFNKLCHDESRAEQLLKEMCRLKYIETGYGPQFWRRGVPKPVKRWYLTDLGYSIYEHFCKLESLGVWSIRTLGDQAHFANRKG
jgi:hypothetical protein